MRVPSCIQCCFVTNIPIFPSELNNISILFALVICSSQMHPFSIYTPYACTHIPHTHTAHIHARTHTLSHYLTFTNASLFRYSNRKKEAEKIGKYHREGNRKRIKKKRVESWFALQYLSAGPCANILDYFSSTTS